MFNPYSFAYIIILFIILILYFNKLYKNNCNKININDNRIEIVKHNILSDNEVNNLYMLIYKLDKIFKEFEIEYFIIAGSLLGSYRHTGLMPWDDDIDIGIIDTLEYILYSNVFKELLEKNNMEIKYDNEICLKIFIKNINYPFIDIFIFQNVNNKIIYKYKYPKLLWPGEYFYKNELYPLINYHYGPLLLPGANNAYNYLKRSFGLTVFLFIINNHNHNPNSKFKNYNKISLLNERLVSYPTIKIE